MGLVPRAVGVDGIEALAELCYLDAIPVERATVGRSGIARMGGDIGLVEGMRLGVVESDIDERLAAVRAESLRGHLGVSGGGLGSVWVCAGLCSLLMLGDGTDEGRRCQFFVTVFYPRVLETHKSVSQEGS